jgi:hypothetical protein
VKTHGKQSFVGYYIQQILQIECSAGLWLIFLFIDHPKKKKKSIQKRRTIGEKISKGYSKHISNCISYIYIVLVLK